MSKISKIIDIKIVGTQQLQELEATILKTEQKLKNMTQAGKKNAGMQKIHAKNIVNTKLKLKQLRQERNAESKAILNSQKNLVKLDGSYNSLVKRNQQLLAKMKASTGGINSNSTAMQKMKAEYTANNGKLKEFDKSLGNNFRNVGNYGSALGGVKEKLAATGLAIGGAIVAFQAMSRIVQSITGDFGEFEKGFTNVLSLMSSDDIAKFGSTLEAGAIEVMKEFGLEINDMNKALFDAVSAGVPAGESIEFLRVASQLAVGGVTDLTTATDGITTVMNAFGLETANAEEIASAFFSAQKFGKTTVEELSQTIGTVAPIAKQAGLGYKELLSAMAVLTKQGLNTNIATTALKGAIGALTKPAESAKKEFDKLGISYGISALRGEGFMNVLKQISDAAEKDADALTKLIPNVKALTGIGALGTAQLEDYDNILQQVNVDYGENSSLAEAVAMQQDTLKEATNRLNAEYSAQKILLGRELKPVFNAILNTLSFLVKNFTNIGKALGTGVVAWTAYSVAIAIGTARSKGFSLATIDLRGKIRALNATIMKNPIALLVAAIAGAVTAYVAWNRQLTDLEKNQRNIDNINKSAEASSLTQVNNIQNLLSLARDESQATGLREQAVAKLNQEVEELNGNLTLEEINTQATTDAIERNTNKILTNAKVKASQSKLEELFAEQLEVEGKSLDQNARWYDYITAAIKSQGSVMKGSVELITLGAKRRFEDVDGLTKQQEEIAKYILSLTAESLATKEGMTLKDIETKKYGLSVVGLQKKLKDLKTIEETSVDGSQTQDRIRKAITKTTRELTKAIEEQNGSTLSKQQVDKLQEKTLNQISAKKAEYNKLLKDEIVNSNKYKIIQKEIIRLNEKAKEGEIEVTVAKENKIDKINDEIITLQNMEKVLKGKEGVEIEATKNALKLAQARLQLIFAEAEAGKELDEDALKRIGEFKTEIAQLQNSIKGGGEDDGSILDGIFGDGEDGQERFENTMAGLNAINGLITERARLIQAEADAKVKNLNTEEAAEIKRLQDSKRFQSLTAEQQEKELLAIEEKYQTQRDVIEKDAFEKTKKAQKQQAIIAGAMAIMRLAADVPKADFGVMTGILIAAQIAMTKMQLDAIDKTTFALGGMIPKFAKGGDLSGGGVFSGKSHKQGGIKFHTGGTLMEAEGGEAIINKQSTSMFRNELSAINQAGGGVKFADGGITKALDGAIAQRQDSILNDDDIGRIASALNTQEVVVTEQSVSSTQRSVMVQESRMSF
jgi:TP901 family phage tail tape measure protein